jgi:hypothetical protein
MLRASGLEQYASPHFQQTTKTLVEESDVLVFMEREHYIYCKDWLDSKRQKTSIWDIADISSPPPEIMAEVARTFEIIRERTDMLLTELGFSSGLRPSASK